jgi:ATP-dependent DNA helicase RecG
MNNNEFIIENLLQQGSDRRLSVIDLFSIELIAQTVTGFLNSNGGDVIIGVSNKNKIVGVTQAVKKAEELKKLIFEVIKPFPSVSIDVVSYKNKDVLLVSVWEGAKKPYHFKGDIYVRENSITKLASPQKLTSLIDDRKKADFHWERMPVLGASISDLNRVEVYKTQSLYRNQNNKQSFKTISSFLTFYGFLGNGNITNACLLLLGKLPVKYIPQCKIRITTYPGKIKGNKIISDKILEGNIFANIESAFILLEDIYGKTQLINELTRTVKKNYPMLAFREAFVNAVAHRDYNSANSFLQVSIYSDRTEISNYGNLLPGITINDFKNTHNSILRNPDIAYVCYVRGYMEMLGGGTLRMIEDCKKNRFKSPVWKQENNVIRVIFQGVGHNRKGEGVTEGVTEGVNKKTQKNIEKIIEGVTEGVSEDVKGRLLRIVTVIYQKQKLNGSDISTISGIPVKSIERYIKQLKNAGILVFDGAPKTGGYVLTKKVVSKLAK